MKRLILLLPLLFALPAAAQDPNGTVTGVESPSPEAGGAGIDPSKVEGFLRGVQAADMALDITARGKSETALGVGRLHVDAKWSEQRSGSPRLTELTVTPGRPAWFDALRAIPPGTYDPPRTISIPGFRRPIKATEIRHLRGDRISLRTGRWGSSYNVSPNGQVTHVSSGIGRRGGRVTLREPDRLAGRINQVTLKNGVMKLDISGAPDLTVEKVTWERDKQGRRIMRMHVNFWPDLIVQHDGTVEVNAFGGIEVGKLEMLTRIDTWPPKLDDVMDAIQGGESDGAGLTGHDLELRYQLTGKARPYAFPFTSLVEAGSSFDVRGAVALRPDGSVQTIGTRNTVVLDLTVGAGTPVQIGQLEGASRLTGTAGASSAHYEATYAISVPAKDMANFQLTLDGVLDYKVSGRNIALSLPTGTLLTFERGTAAGHTRLGATVGGGSDSVTLADGTYQIEIDGALSVQKLAFSKLAAEDLDFTGRVNSSGTLTSNPRDGLRLQGKVSGTLDTQEVAGDEGFVDVLLDGFQGKGRVGNGSTAEFQIDELTLDSDPLQPGAPTGIRSVRAEGVHVDANTQLLEGQARDGNNQLTVGKTSLETDVTFTASSAGQLEALRGSVDARLLEDGEVVVQDGLPGRPRLPERQASPTVTPSSASTPAVSTTLPASTQPQTQVVTLPLVHKVVKGDTLWGIAHANGLDVAALKGHNRLTSNTIGEGLELKIPGKTTEWEVPVEQPAQTVVETPVVETPVVETPAVETQPAVEGREASPGRLRQTVASGSTAKLEIESARMGETGLEIDGFVTAALVLGAAELQSSYVDAKILGQAQLALAKSGFSWRSGQPNSLRMGRVQVPVRIQLTRGTRVKIETPNKPSDIEIDRDGSYATFTAQVLLTAEGARIDEITEADLFLESTGVASFGGDVASVPGEKSIRFQGRIVLLKKGLDFYGDLTVKVRGDRTTPIIKIRW